MSWGTRSTSPNVGRTRPTRSASRASSPGRSSDFDGDTYRAVYTVKLRGAVYVLHVFQKKSTRGIATPRREIALIKERYRWARVHHAAHYGAQEER